MRVLITIWFVFLSFFLSAQESKSIELKDIWSGKFVPQRMKGFHPMNDGEHYTRLSRNPETNITTVNKYSFQTFKKVKTIISSDMVDEITPFGDYIFSQDESKMLLQTDYEQIYRHSKKGKYYVYDILTREATLLSNNMIQEPTFSPNNKYIGYVFENNIYIKDINTGETTQITNDGTANKVINGITDWVYEEEFAFVRAYYWNSAGDKIAFMKFDESEVPEFSMPTYGSSLYPRLKTFKYPKAGEANSKVTLHIYNIKEKSTTDLKVESYYIPRMKWTKSSNILSIQTLNRHQNDLHLLVYNVQENKISTLLHESSTTYIDITDNLIFLKNGDFIWTSEKDGYNHLYRYSKRGKLRNQITKGHWEVTSIYGYSPLTKKIFYQSTERGSIYRDVYAIAFNGTKKKRLSVLKGTNNAEFSKNMNYYIIVSSSTNHPPRYTLHKSDGSVLKDIITNDVYANKIRQYNLPKKVFSTININGNSLNMWMIKPLNFKTSKSYPLFITQYSGPGSQSVSDKWASANDFWYMMLAQQGYVIACVDGRGTGLKGSQFKKITYKMLGKYEVEDQKAFAEKLSQKDYIDSERTGIWGWSYGGFVSSNCILKGSDIFEMAIAVAPVTNWRFYDTIYTERYMQTPQENPSGYDENSPINHVNKLKGKYLLIHGSADDNVHFQNTMKMTKALVDANKQFDMLIYPDKSHSIYGGNTRLHLYTKMTSFIKNNL